MEWIVPVLFVLATAAQWWLKRHQDTADKPLPLKPSKSQGNPEPVEQEPFDDFGDLLEALGRRRHESPPPPVLSTPQSEPPKKPAVTPPAPVLVEARAVFQPPSLPVIPAISQPVVFQKAKETPRFRRHGEHDSKSSPIRSRLRDAVIMSEILAPPLALR